MSELKKVVLLSLIIALFLMMPASAGNIAINAATASGFASATNGAAYANANNNYNNYNGGTSSYNFEEEYNLASTLKSMGYNFTKKRYCTFDNYANIKGYNRNWMMYGGVGEYERNGNVVVCKNMGSNTNLETGSKICNYPIFKFECDDGNTFDIIASNSSNYCSFNFWSLFK